MLPLANRSKKSVISKTFITGMLNGFKILTQVFIKSEGDVFWYFKKQFIRQKISNSIMEFSLEMSTPKLEIIR
jgi:hypothetical protein